ncbi:MAG: NmrA family NAD(P)-binding protein, partial [Verrucomicrobiota bacterium]
MTGKKIIAVVGATGAQGSGLCRAILEDKGGEFAVRALTRNTRSDKAKELERLGAEVVAADVDDVGSLTQAFRGAHGAFCVTFFWEHFSPEKEVAQARNMAAAAKEA